MNFEAYLISKKIDSSAFQAAEKSTWETWKTELEQMHPNSFTAQKLYLINPIRRKYPLKEIPVVAPVIQTTITDEVKTETTTPPPVAAKPKPVMRPKPKIS